jgi:hypothetical protein
MLGVPLAINRCASPVSGPSGTAPKWSVHGRAPSLTAELIVTMPSLYIEQVVPSISDFPAVV